jgi:hypothetical protein
MHKQNIREYPKLLKIYWNYLRTNGRLIIMAAERKAITKTLLKAGAYWNTTHIYSIELENYEYYIFLLTRLAGTPRSGTSKDAIEELEEMDDEVDEEDVKEERVESKRPAKKQKKNKQKEEVIDYEE